MLRALMRAVPMRMAPMRMAPMRVAAIILLAASLARAQTTLPSLAALDEATRALYREAESHVVRVQVPVRIPIDHPLVKWQAQLNPVLRKQIEAARLRGEAPHLYVDPSTTQPSATTEPSAAVVASVQATRIPFPAPSTVVNIECAGVVMNDRGHVLVPVFVDKAYAPVLQVSVDEVKASAAEVVATDRLTGLTVIRLSDFGATPAHFASEKPLPGSTILMIALTRRAAHMGIWSGGQADDSGLLVNASGEFAGIVRNGHTLYPATFLPIVQQLIDAGEVRRAELGVTIHEVPVDDPQRLKFPALGARTAARVDEVRPDTAAARGGLAAGDIILALAGESVTDIPTFAAAIANRRGNTRLLILRDGEERAITVDLEPAD